MIIFSLVISLILLDQVIKYIVVTNITLFNSIPVINNFFYLTHTTNKGAAWGILQNMNILFIPGTIIILAFFIYFMMKNKSFL